MHEPLLFRRGLNAHSHPRFELHVRILCKLSVVKFETVDCTADHGGTDYISACSVLHKSVFRVNCPARNSSGYFSVAALEILASVFGIRLVEAFVTCLWRTNSLVRVDGGHRCCFIARELGSVCVFCSSVLVSQVQKVAEAATITGNSIACLLEGQSAATHLTKAEALTALWPLFHVRDGVSVEGT